MSTGSNRLGDLIAAAREDGPSAVDRARIAEKLAARIAAVDGGSPGAPGMPPPPAGAPRLGAPGGVAGTGVVAAGGVLLALGIAVVLSRGREPTVRLDAVSSPPALTSVVLDAPLAESHDRTAEPAFSASPRDADAAGSSPEEAEEAASASDRRGGAPTPHTPRPASSASAAPMASPAVVPAPRASSLAEELALLRDARAAARGDDPAGSLALLDELDRRHPDGVLHEERRASRVVALCAMGDQAAAAEAARFLRELPSSVHAERVRAACPAP